MISKRRKIFNSLIFLFISLSLVFFAWGFMGAKLQGKSMELIEAKRALLVAKARQGNLESDEALYKQINNDREKIDSFFVDLDVPVNIIKFWESIAIQSGVTIVIDSAQSQTSGDVWKSQAFKITMTGQVENSLQFLERLETAPYMTEIQSFFSRILNANESGKSDDLGKMKSEIIIKVYAKQ